MTPAEASGGSPLGPSYVLVPLPDEDEAMLGRVLLSPMEHGRSLEQVSRPNECADKLTPKKTGPLASIFEDGQELASGGKARAALGAFGFEGDVQVATHFYYKLEVSKRVAQTDTTEYVACCKAKGTCGYGFVSALVYGSGEYATASESRASGSINIPVAGGAGGFVTAKVLHKRSVHGYVAALVTVTDPAAAKAISILGDPAAAGITLTEQSLPEQVKARFEARKIQVREGEGGPIDTAYAFKDGNGDITENEFIRRYHAATGSSELDPAKKNRQSVMLVAGGIILAVGIGTSLYGYTHLSKPCDPYDYNYSFVAGPSLSGSCSNGFATDAKNPSAMPPAGYVPNVLPISGSDKFKYWYDPNEKKDNETGFWLTTVGTIISVTGAGFIIGGIVAGDGNQYDHSITKFDAALYAAKYNRAVLHQTIKETETRMKQLSSDASGVTVKPVLTLGFVGLTGRFLAGSPAAYCPAPPRSAASPFAEYPPAP